jgi:hypothetical protein
MLAVYSSLEATIERTRQIYTSQHPDLVWKGIWKGERLEKDWFRERPDGGIIPQAGRVFKENGEMYFDIFYQIIVELVDLADMGRTSEDFKQLVDALRGQGMGLGSKAKINQSFT